MGDGVHLLSDSREEARGGAPLGPEQKEERGRGKLTEHRRGPGSERESVVLSKIKTAHPQIRDFKDYPGMSRRKFLEERIENFKIYSEWKLPNSPAQRTHMKMPVLYVVIRIRCMVGLRDGVAGDLGFVTLMLCIRLSAWGRPQENSPCGA
ncbi:OCIA domain-containing protein 2 isoform X3 [Pseudorca crassidens]|uniref:OCIA domain-containing protein 2 isoform X3 n=1 Tax=Pseudorca crassidens TaxID=82174 RepID=UPI00352FC9B9